MEKDTGLLPQLSYELFGQQSGTTENRASTTYLTEPNIQTPVRQFQFILTNHPALAAIPLEKLPGTKEGDCRYLFLVCPLVFALLSYILCLSSLVFPTPPSTTFMLTKGQPLC